MNYFRINTMPKFHVAICMHSINYRLKKKKKGKCRHKFSFGPNVLG